MQTGLLLKPRYYTYTVYLKLFAQVLAKSVTLYYFCEEAKRELIKNIGRSESCVNERSSLNPSRPYCDSLSTRPKYGLV